MATKAKPKAKKTAPKKAAPKAKKTTPRKRARKPSAPAVMVAPGGFVPGAKVGIFPLHVVGFERSIGREPMSKPTKSVKAGKDGSLHVSGLAPGQWVAAARAGDRWRYLQFPVK